MRLSAGVLIIAAITIAAPALADEPPIDSVNTAGPTLLAKKSYGIGADETALLLESTEYPWAATRFGWYLGFGFFISSDYRGHSSHGGLALQNGILSGGLGLGYSKRERPFITAPSLWGTTWRLGPHAWVEIGPRFGPAARLHYGPAGIGGSVHARFGRPRRH